VALMDCSSDSKDPMTSMSPVAVAWIRCTPPPEGKKGALNRGGLNVGSTLPSKFSRAIPAKAVFEFKVAKVPPTSNFPEW